MKRIGHILHDTKYSCLCFSCRSIVYLQIDNRLCTENCFPTADTAAKYLGALSAAEMLRFPYPLKEVRGEYGYLLGKTIPVLHGAGIWWLCYFSTGEKLKEPFNSIPEWGKLMLVAIASLFLLIILMIGMLITRRKREHSTLWFPEGFFLKKEPSSNKNRREPVGQDALGMK